MDVMVLHLTGYIPLIQANKLPKNGYGVNIRSVITSGILEKGIVHLKHFAV